MRKIGWTFILAAAVASVFGAVTTISEVLGGLLVGLFAAAVIRYMLGRNARAAAARSTTGVTGSKLHLRELMGATVVDLECVYPRPKRVG